MLRPYIYLMAGKPKYTTTVGTQHAASAMHCMVHIVLSQRVVGPDAARCVPTFI